MGVFTDVKLEIGFQKAKHRQKKAIEKYNKEHAPVEIIHEAPLKRFPSIQWELNWSHFKHCQKEFRKVNHCGFNNELQSAFAAIATMDNKKAETLSKDELISAKQKFDRCLSIIQKNVVEFGNKKEKSLIAQTAENIKTHLKPDFDNLIKIMDDKIAELHKQKAELNSGKNVANNDPQKAEKLAKIAKLQRELDELKGEVSEDFEPEIVDKNN